MVDDVVEAKNPTPAPAAATTPAPTTAAVATTPAEIGTAVTASTAATTTSSGSVEGERGSREGYVVGPNGEEISEYEYRRHLKVRRNILQLASLGLVATPPGGGAARSISSSSVSSSTRHEQRRRSAAVAPVRRSARISGESSRERRRRRRPTDRYGSATLDAHPYDRAPDDVVVVVVDLDHRPSPPPAKRRRRSVNHKDMRILDATEREELARSLEAATTTGWIEDMEHYMTHTLRNSETNVRMTMRQVRRMVAGDGVRHQSSRRPGNVFRPRTKISITDDLASLHVEAASWVDDHGGDVSHGWLVQHPIRKMMFYQAARFERGKPFLSASD